MGQILCSDNDSVPTAEFKIDDIVSSSTASSPCNHYRDAEPSLSSHSQTLGSNLLSHNVGFDEPVEEVKIDSMQNRCGTCFLDYGLESEPVVPKRCSFKSTYRLVEDEIDHRRLNPQMPVARNFGRPSSRYSQSKGIHNSTERLNRDRLRSDSDTPRSREDQFSSRAPRRARPQARYRRSMFGLRGSTSSPRGHSYSGTNEPIGFRMTDNHPNADVFLRYYNLFTNSDRGFREQPSNFHGFERPPGFSFNRGFDNDGFFFFTVNLQGAGRQNPAQATKEQIEKAVSQLKGLTSDLEIKKGDTCPICLEQFRTTDDVVEMPCPCKRTFFHRKCAVDTLEKTKKIKCPNCRRWDGNNSKDK